MPRPLLLALALLATLASAQPRATATPPTARAASRSLPRADLALYGEALCPDTAAYVTRLLAPLLASGVVGVGNRSAAAELRFVGYGNAAPAAGGGIECQHGKKVCGYGEESEKSVLGGCVGRPAATRRCDSLSFPHLPTPHTPHQECALNRALNCAQALAPSSFPATLTCYFGGDLSASGLDTCLTAHGGTAASPARVDACAKSEQGDSLEAAAREDTEGLAPPKKSFVPWVTVDGVALGAGCGDTGRYVCVAAVARGGGVPAGCAAAAGAPPSRCPGAPSAAVAATTPRSARWVRLAGDGVFGIGRVVFFLCVCVCTVRFNMQ